MENELENLDRDVKEIGATEGWLAAQLAALSEDDLAVMAVSHRLGTAPSDRVLLLWVTGEQERRLQQKRS